MNGHLNFWILDEEHNPVPVEWSNNEMTKETLAFMNNDELRKVGSTQIGDYHVSTVFLLVDHNWNRPDEHEDPFDEKFAPVLFETMVFDKDRKPVNFEEKSELQEISEVMFGKDIFSSARRYKTWNEALFGHKEIVDLVSTFVGDTPEDLI